MQKARLVAGALGLLAVLAPTLRPVPARAAISATLAGAVRDSSGAPLAHASVLLPGLRRGALAGADGRFTIENLAPGTHLVRASSVGYASATRTVTIEAGETATVDFVLRRAPIPETEVEVRDTRLTRENAPSVFPLEPRTVKTTAGTLENVFRTLATYPGVVSTTDYTSRVSVRGGGPDQNLVLLDDVEIYNPYRVFGLVSAFNPETVSDFTLSGGGFPARYGNRLSALLYVTNRDGLPYRRPGGTASLSLTDANLVAEGALPGALGGAASGTWLATSRRTYYDLVANSIVGTQLPFFFDFQGKLALQPSARDRVSAFGLYSHERTNATLTESGPVDNVHFFDTSRNDVTGVTWAHSDGRLANRLTGSYYKNTDLLAFDGSFIADSKITNVPGDETIASVVFDRAIGVRDATLRDELGVTLGPRHLATVGGEWHAMRTDLHYSIDPLSDRNPRVGNPTDARGGSAAPDTFLMARPSTRWALFAQDEWTVAGAARATLGVRADYGTVNRDFDLSPRASLAAPVPGGLTLRAATGLFTQTPGYEKFLDADYFVRLDAPGPLAVRNERAVHYIVGLERPIGTAWSAQLEGFVKSFAALVIGRLETEEERAARFARYAFPAELDDEIPREAQITAYPVNGATGLARGVDLYIARREQGPDDRFWGWLSYTYGVANREAYGRTIPFDYDRRHTLNVVGTFRVARRLELAATGHYGSGFPYDPASGVTVATVVDTATGAIVPDRDDSGNLIWQPRFDGVRSLGAARLPAFFEVDVRLTWRPRWFSRPWALYLDIINVLNRTNVVEISPVLRADTTSDRPRLDTDVLKNFPFLPTIGVSFAW